MKSLKCRDVGTDCDHVITGENEAEIMKKAAEHGRTEHGMKELSEELKSKIRPMIKDVKAA